MTFVIKHSFTDTYTQISIINNLIWYKYVHVDSYKSMTWALDNSSCRLLASLGKVVVSDRHVMVSSPLEHQDGPLEGCGGIVE